MASSTDEEDEDLVAKARADRAGKRNIFGRIALFFHQTIEELKKVRTPSRKELISLTITVVIFVVMMVLFLWLVDTLFGLLMTYLFGGGLTG